MNNIKQSDEVYCPECGKLIKKDFAICPYCKKDLSNKEPDGWQKTADVGKAAMSLGKALFTILSSLAVLVFCIFLLYSCWPR